MKSGKDVLGNNGIDGKKFLEDSVIKELMEIRRKSIVDGFQLDDLAASFHTIRANKLVETLFFHAKAEEVIVAIMIGEDRGRTIPIMMEAMKIPSAISKAIRVVASPIFVPDIGWLSDAMG